MCEHPIEDSIFIYIRSSIRFLSPLKDSSSTSPACLKPFFADLQIKHVSAHNSLAPQIVTMKNQGFEIFTLPLYCVLEKGLLLNSTQVQIEMKEKVKPKR